MTGGAVLSRAEIVRRMHLPPEDGATLSVIPSGVGLVQLAALDVRLGSYFKEPREIAEPIDAEGPHSGDLFRELFVPPGETFVLQPGRFVLGVTFEFVVTPRDVVTFVEGRSRLGRLGLVVATATQVAPGFHGCVVLELANVGRFALQLRTGMRIAQLVFVRTDEMVAGYGDGETRMFDCQIAP